jgi:hypothetical protein
MMMLDGRQFDLRRALSYVGAATLLAFAVGVLREGTVAGGLGFAVVIGVGVAVGLGSFEAGSGHLDGRR